MAKTRNWQEVRDTPVNYRVGCTRHSVPSRPPSRAIATAIRPVDSCGLLSHKELERRGDADVRGIVGQAWWPKPIAH